MSIFQETQIHPNLSLGVQLCGRTLGLKKSKSWICLRMMGASATLATLATTTCGGTSPAPLDSNEESRMEIMLPSLLLSRVTSS